jgi:3-oxoacyl-[acyl-carrier protein] reductase
MNRFDGRRAIVTGAAGGIGAAIVARLLAEGATVAAIDRNTKALASLPDNAALHRIAGNLRSIEATRETMRSALSALGGVPDVVVCAAGVYALAPAAQIEAEDWDFNQDINLRAPFFVAQAAVAARAAGDVASGHPMANVNIGSVGA